MIGPRAASVGERHKRVTLSRPGPSVPDGDGGYTTTTEPLDPPQMYARIRPASQRDLERVMAGTQVTTATHLVEMPYHEQVTQATQILVDDYPHPDRLFEVVYVGNPEERDSELVLVCAEVLSDGNQEVRDRDQRAGRTSSGATHPPAGIDE